MKEIDPYAFEEVQKMSGAQRKPYLISQDEKERKAFDGKWDKLNSKLSNTQKDWKDPEYPFRPGIVIREYNDLYKKIYDKEKFINM